MAVFAILLSLPACSHGSKTYSAEDTWRCLANEGLSASLQSGPDLTPGVDSSIGFQRLATKPKEAVASGGFAFLRKDSRPQDVKRRFEDNRRRVIGGPPGLPWYKVGETRRNVIAWWSDTADASFKRTARNCLR
jgi:hypothetical protein